MCHTIQGESIFQIALELCAHLILFDYSLNCTPLGPITITYHIPETECEYTYLNVHVAKMLNKKQLLSNS